MYSMTQSLFRIFNILMVLVSLGLAFPGQDKIALNLKKKELSKRATGWDNSYDGILNFECPAGQSVYSIESQHNNYYEDRQFRLGCRVGPISNDCSWSRFVNNFDEPVQYNCGDQAVITGWYSEHNNYYEDRISKFKCCKLSRGVLTNCQITDYLNDFDGWLSYQVPIGRFLYGVLSIHNNYYEDRRFRFETCAA